MMASLVVVECWSGPACGISVEVDDSVLSFFVRLPIRVDDTGRPVGDGTQVWKVPPAAPYAEYVVGQPKAGKARWHATQC